MGMKSRGNFKTGLTECFATCKCVECRKKKKRRKKSKGVVGEDI